MSDTIIINPSIENDTIIINPNNDCDSIVINPIIESDSIIIDDDDDIVLSVNGRIGNVVLTSNDVGLTIVNTNSANWDSSYSSVYANSALWTQGGNSVALQSLSANWNSNYIITNSLSANWNSAYSTWNSNSAFDLAARTFVNSNSSNILQSNSIVNKTSANWNSVYSDVNLLSANWNKSYDISTEYQNVSGFFATNTFLQSTSTLLTPLTLTDILTSQLVLNTTLNTLSGSWQNTFTTVQSNSATTWNYQGTDLKTLSSQWIGGNEAYTNLISNSAAYLSAVDLSLIQSTSANWNESYNISTEYQNTSGSFATDTLLQNTSALLTPLTLTETLTSQLVLNSTLNELSGNWQSSFETVNSLSGNWDSAYSSWNSTSATLATIAFTDSKYLPLSGGEITGKLGINNAANYFDLDVASIGNSYGDLGLGSSNNILINPNGNLILTQNIGNVGVGTTTPTTKLDVNGVITATGGNSDQWNEAYINSTVYTNNSASYATNDYVDSNFFNLTGGTISGATRINNNLTVFGNLTATGTTTFANTIFSTTSSLSVVHVGSGPALWVGNNGDGDIASFYDMDANVEVFHVGGNTGSHPNVGVKTSTPNVDFTVNGQISANNIIWDANGNSDNWNSAFNISTTYQNTSGSFATNTTLNAASSVLLPTSIYQSASGNWQSAYTSWNSASATSIVNFNDTRFAKLSSQAYTLVNATSSIRPIRGNNTASGYNSNVAGGSGNTASGRYSTVSGGYGNTASGCHSNVAGGRANTASGNYSSILGGSLNNTNNQANTFILGSNITAPQADYTYVNNLSSQGTIVSPTISANNIFGQANETVLTDGSSLIGNGTNTLTLNYLSGAFINSNTRVNGQISANNTIWSAGGNSNNWNSNFTSWNSASATSVVSFNDTRFSKLSSQAYTLTNSTTASIRPILGGNTATGSYSVIAGGRCNTASGNYSNVAGGGCNTASGFRSTVTGGTCNTASGCYSFVAGGRANTASSYASNIAGGAYNVASGCISNVAGGTINTASGYMSNVAGGTINTASGYYSNVAGGTINTASGYMSNVAGGTINTASGCHSNVAGGRCNTASGSYSNIAGGRSNIASGNCSNVAGGFTNTASASSSNVAGGRCNTASGNYSNVTGGGLNRASGSFSFVAGGSANDTKGFANTFILGSSLSATQANFTYVNNLSSQGTIVSPTISANNIFGESNETVLTDGSSLIGNGTNTLTLNYLSGAFINSNTRVNGQLSATNIFANNIAYTLIDATSSIRPIRGNNIASGNYSNVAGGCRNTASGVFTTITGGRNNTASGTYSVIVGGDNNNAIGQYVYIGGARNSTASGFYANINGGANNIAGGPGSTIAGGNQNRTCANAFDVVISGGLCNVACGCRSVIAGGCCNTAVSNCTVIGGGISNTASGIFSIVNGGFRNTASGIYSFVAGGSANDTKGFANTFILGSSLSATQANFTYVNNLSSQGTIVSPTISANNIFGESNETVLTDGSSLIGHGANTLTMNYLSGVYIRQPNASTASRLYMYSPNGTRYILNVTNAGTLTVTAG